MAYDNMLRFRSREFPYAVRITVLLQKLETNGCNYRH